MTRGYIPNFVNWEVFMITEGSLTFPQQLSILYNVTDKNAQAQQIIKDYAAMHSAMDIGVGLISLVPGAAIPAIMGAIALQNKVVYKPMAADLAAVYLTASDSYTDRLGDVAAFTTVGMEFAQEFSIEFLSETAYELLLETGFGALATFIPFVGAAVAGVLDYLIAQMMTWRVGTMASIYFQNGGEWIESRKTTMGIAKELTGGLGVSADQLLNPTTRANSRAKNVRVDFDDIPRKVPEVMHRAVENILPLLKAFADKLPRSVVRESLLSMRIPEIMVDAAMRMHYDSVYA